MMMSRRADRIVRRKKEGVCFELANRLFFRLYQASNLMHKTGSRSVSEFGSTTQQWAVLGALSRPAVREHGMTVKELIEFLLTSRLIERVRIATDRRNSPDPLDKTRRENLEPDGHQYPRLL
jgi:hypothetical protein